MSTFFTTNVFVPVEYSEIKAIAVAHISTLPSATNVNTIVPQYTEENISSKTIIELTKQGGPIEGEIIAEGHTIKYGIEYEKDEDGNLIYDDDGMPVTKEDNGVLYGIKVNDATKDFTFNSIIVYSNEIHAETNAPTVAIVSLFNNSLSLDKILNFFAKYIITVEREYIELTLDWLTEYGAHETQTNTNSFYLKEQHPQLAQRVMLASGNANEDEVLQLQKQYESFIKDRDNYLFIKPVKDNLFNDEILSTSIQTHQNAKLYKYEDSTIKTPYLYFYYNIVATRKAIMEGIIDAQDNTEDKGAVAAITVEQLRRHIKIGFSETAGTFLYTWFSTAKFIYVICYGSNSNNNVDIYRVRNRSNVDINDANYNLIVGRYVDRIYFTIDGNLYVCVPQVKGRTTEVVSDNERFREEAKTALETHDFLYVNFDAITEEEIIEAYNTVWKDIDAYNSADYLLNKEQFYVFILSKNPDYQKFITDGKFVYPEDEEYTPPPDASEDKPKSAYDFYTLGLYQTDDNYKSRILMQDMRNVYQYIKRPLDIMNQFTAYMDSLVNECISYQDSNGVASYKTPYVNQISIRLIERLKPNYPIETSDVAYRINWWGQNKDSGVKTNVLKFTMCYGDVDNAERDKYDNYIETRFSETYENNIIDIIYNVLERSKVETKLPVGNKTFETYMSGVVDRLQKKDASYTTDQVLSSFKEYFFKAIYKETDIVSVENAFRRFYRYSAYRALYDTVVATSKSYQNYVLREYLVASEKKGGNDGDLIDSYNSMTIPELDAYWNANVLSPLTTAMSVGTWWDEDVLKKLEELYSGVIFTPLYITYAYGKTDECYYNGKSRKDIVLTDRDAEIPYRYGFPLPNYIYNTNTSEVFTIPATEEVEISGTYYSKAGMEEELLIPQKDGEVETQDKLDELIALRKDYEVDIQAELDKLSNATALTNDVKTAIDGITKYYGTLPSSGEEDVYYYVKDNNAIYKYTKPTEEGGVGSYSYITSYPTDGDTYLLDNQYYKVSTAAEEKDFVQEVSNNTFDSDNKNYKLELKNISKVDVVENVYPTRESNTAGLSYKFTPPVANKEYTLEFINLKRKTETIIPDTETEDTTPDATEGESPDTENQDTKDDTNQSEGSDVSNSSEDLKEEASNGAEQQELALEDEEDATEVVDEETPKAEETPEEEKKLKIIVKQGDTQLLEQEIDLDNIGTFKITPKDVKEVETQDTTQTDQEQTEQEAQEEAQADEPATDAQAVEDGETTEAVEDEVTEDKTEEGTEAGKETTDGATTEEGETEEGATEKVEKIQAVTIQIEGADADTLNITYISSDDKRIITVTETSYNSDGDTTEETKKELCKKEIDLKTACEKLELDLTCSGGKVEITAENTTIESAIITYKDTFNKVTWNTYNKPKNGDMAYVKKENKYYELEDTWNEITQEDLRNRYVNKIYFVTKDKQYYKFSGLTWMSVNATYNIPMRAYYKVLNENELITKELTPTIEEQEKENNYLSKFTGIVAKQKYKISASGIGMIDDREIINIDVTSSDNKYAFTPKDTDKKYDIKINGIQKLDTAFEEDENKKLQVVFKHASETVEATKKKEGDADPKTVKYTFTPEANKQYIIKVTTTATETEAEADDNPEEATTSKILLKKGTEQVETKKVTNNQAEITYTPTATDELTIEAENATIESVIITKAEEILETKDAQEGANTFEYTPKDTKAITIEIQNGHTDDMPTISYIKTENSGLKRTLLIKQDSNELYKDELTFADPSEVFNKEYDVTTTNTSDIVIEIKQSNIETLSAVYSYTRKPEESGVKYYQWIGNKFVQTTVAIIPAYSSCNWYLEDIDVYFNIYIEGEKLNVIRDLFLDIDGSPCKVVQFDFSDIGDVVLVKNYNKTGQNCWGGVFSRYASATQVDSTKKVYSFGAVMSDNFLECFNWDAYNYVQFSTDANGDRIISDERIKAIQATYEVSRSHYEVLVHKFGDNMVFSNALTVAWEKSATDLPYTHTMFIYPKNIKMFPNMTTIPYSGIRFLVNNYFVIEADAWFDMIYNRYYKMNTGIQPEYYKKRFLSAQRSLVVVAISDHDDTKGYSGAISYFNCNNWYDKTRVADYIEKVNIPQKDV